MGALSVLSLKNNDLGTKAAGKVLGEMLRVNSVLKELDLSSNKPHCGDPVGFAQELALGIKDNGTISYDVVHKETLVQFLKEQIPDNAEQAERLADHMFKEYKYSVAQLVQICLERFGRAPAVTTILKDMGALTILNLSANNLGGWNGMKGWHAKYDTSGKQKANP
jgi:hypothetical protein